MRCHGNGILWPKNGAVGRAGANLRRELLPQFLTDSHEIWHRCLSWGVDVQETFFDSGKKCVAMVTAYCGGNATSLLFVIHVLHILVFSLELEEYVRLSVSART